MATHTPPPSAPTRPALAPPPTPTTDREPNDLDLWREAPPPARQPTGLDRPAIVLSAPPVDHISPSAPLPESPQAALAIPLLIPAQEIPGEAPSPAPTAPPVEETPEEAPSNVLSLPLLGKEAEEGGAQEEESPPPAQEEKAEEESVQEEGVPALEAIEVTKSLPLGRERIDILRGISLRIAHGELVALVGPSGSGKSTLLGIIAGLDSPTTGRVLVDGVDITHKSEGQLASVRNQKIGMVYQAFNLIPNLTALENVVVPLYVGHHPGSPEQRARELLELVGLGHRLGNRPHQLSGGEQQRVAIARALATNPAIVIMDEPTGNLDRTNSEHMLEMIRDLRERTGKTFIIATHDTSVAAAADRAIHIVDGQLADS